ncbi:hypothetical protein L195_g022298 [Trifolium pratense]|uniref:Uncharacterized protein n=1 Tax=Trifolium pratense TaxID=57577 RepID=A0A2K3N7K9_TRIPR|nr:hypothetical protein L195_g022298 [Trifolium pratense]
MIASCSQSSDFGELSLKMAIVGNVVAGVCRVVDARSVGNVVAGVCRVVTIAPPPFPSWHDGTNDLIS